MSNSGQRPRGGAVADEFYLLAHDDRTGRPRLHHQATALGLAAALLAELLYSGRIAIAGTRLWVINPAPPPDALAHGVLEHLVAERQHDQVRTWLEFLATTAKERVAQRLVVSGRIRREENRRLLRTATAYVPVDINVAAWSWARLSHLLRRHENLDDLDTCLAGLALVTGLNEFVLDGAPREAHAYLQYLVQNSWPPLRDLLQHTSALIGGGVLHHRV